MASTQLIEHVVLFKVKDGAEPSKVDAWVNGLKGLATIDHVLHLTAGPVLRSQSSLFGFTHMLHCRYRSKDDLDAYSAHPDHVRVVKELGFPICEDIMALDWVLEGFDSAVGLAPGSALKVIFLKLKENLGCDVKKEVLEVIKGVAKDSFGPTEQVTYGENFSPARAKGFSIAVLAAIYGPSELKAIDSGEKVVNFPGDKVKDYLDDIIVVDYVIV